MSFFHAFYFMSYTATTIGFGEIPNAFSDGQRLWVTFCIYLVVVAWSYAIIVLVALLQAPHEGGLGDAHGLRVGEVVSTGRLGHDRLDAAARPET